MRKLTLLWAAGIGLATLSYAAADFRALDEATNKAINDVADLLEKGDAGAAKKNAKTFADSKDFDLELTMNSFKLRTKKGIGIGSKPGEVTPDGIELKIEAIVKDGITPATLKKEGGALARAGFVMAAVGHIAIAKAPEKDIGKMKKQDWIDWAEGVTKAAAEFTAAAKADNAGDLKKAASKVKQNCDSCHAVFK